MGLNLDVDHVAFSAVRKFDGQNYRNLTPNEIGQIAGRAGRHMNDGTFGVTGNCEPFDSDLVERLETHTFDSVRVLQWRNRRLEFATLDRLRDSLREMPNEPRLVRARMADDVIALETLANDREIAKLATGQAAVQRLWEVCQLPDYRKISSQSHAEMIGTLFSYLMGPEGRVPEDWFAKQVAFADRTDGDIDTLANRIAHIRTWTFVSNRADWLKDPAHWQGRTRAIEDSLSDALHEQLTQRFVDRRTSALMKGLRDKEELSAEIAEDGAIHVENHFVGRLRGFRFSPETQAEGIHGKAARSAAAHVLSRELGMRARRVAAAKADAFKLSRTARVLWRDEEIAEFQAADDPLKPQVVLLADEHLSGPDREKVQARLETWRDEIISERLKPLVEIAKAEDVTGLARGIAFRLTESFGMLKRELIADMMKSLDQEARAQLRKYGVRFGAFNIYFPALLKPAPAELSATLWTLKNAPAHGIAPDALPELPRAGLTSAPVQAATPEALYRAYGFHVCGPRAVRLDILERLADLIRPLLAWRANPENPTPPPKGATGDSGFVVTPEMMSILGCSPDELSNVLKALGFRLDRKTVPRPSEAPKPETADAAPVADATPADTAMAGEALPATAVETAAEPSASEAAPSESAEPAAPETVVIEIWRPRRHRSEDRPGRREGRHEGERRDGAGRNRGRHRNGGARQGEAVASGTVDAAATPAATGEQAPPADAAQPNKQRHGGGHRDRGRERGERDGDRNRQRQRHRDRDDRRDDKRRHGDRHGPTIHSAAPPKKGGIDPDSPFASLGALRDALAKQAREKNPS